MYIRNMPTSKTILRQKSWKTSLSLFAILSIQSFLMAVVMSFILKYTCMYDVCPFSAAWSVDVSRTRYLESNIDILGIYTAKSYSKTFERNVIYISILTSNHGTSMTSKKSIDVCNLNGCRR